MGEPLEWRIYYTDGSSFDNRDGTPEDAPSRGIAIIILHDSEVGRGMLHKWDWYFWNKEDCQWYGCDQWGLIDHLLDNRATAVKMGRSVSVARWRELLTLAQADTDFAPKLSRRPLEQPEAVK